MADARDDHPPRYPAPREARREGPAGVQDRRRRRDRPVLYLFSTFPSVSETFLLREMNALSRAGLKLRVAALAAGSSAVVHAAAEPWLKSALWRPRRPGPRFLLGVAATCLWSPVSFTSALRMAFSMAPI